MELTTLTLAQLRELQKNIDVQIKITTEREKATARDQILAIAKSVGMDQKALAGLAKGKSGAGVKSVAARYRNPTDASETWTGRGRAPKWAAAMKNAGTFETARI